MEGVKKWLSERSNKRNGFYVHYSPPKLLGAVSAVQLRQWARGGAESRLEKVVLAGQGRRLLAEAESLPLAQHLPKLIAKCDALHAAIERGSLAELQVQLELLDSDYHRRKYIMCRDEAGVGLLHKAIFYDYMDIAEWLVKQYPLLVHQKDSEGRTPLHYAAVCRDEAAAAALLEGAGAARGARDAAGRTPAHYRGPARNLLALPNTADMARETKNPPGLVIKRHNIRIWCHDCDMARLQRVVWEGHGSRLLSEVSNQPVVKKFLEAVPYIMNTIREIHHAVIQNDLESLMKHSGDPVPPQALSCRDANNMTVMHKAAGLGHGGILRYIVDRYPQGINDVDNDGRTPLHYAATVKDEQHTYNMLVSLGADESATDNKNKTPGYYINRPQEIDKNNLKTLPEAPRTASSAYPSSWDWKLLDTEVIGELNKKSRRKNLKASNENISSKNNTNTISESTENETSAIKASSTREFIKDLPDLDDPNKSNENTNQRKDEQSEYNQDTEVVEVNDDQEEKEDEMQAEEENKDGDENSIDETNVDLKTNDNEESNHKNGDISNENEPRDNKEEKNIDNHSNEYEEIIKEHNEIEITSGNDEREEEHKENESNKTDIKENKYNNDDSENVINTDNNEESSHTLPEHHKNEDPVKSEITNDIRCKSSGRRETIENRSSEDIEDETRLIQNETISKEMIKSEPQTHDNDEYSKSVIEQSNTDEGRKVSNVSDNEEKGEPEAAISLDEKSNEKYKEERSNENYKSEDSGDTTNEGNFNNEHSEDDDDVQVQGDLHSEYSDTYLKSTADAADMESAKRGNVTNGRNTQESLISGIVSGEAEQDSQDASITQRKGSVREDVFVVDHEIDPEVTELINSANMEMLATLVLNGEGSRLIGRRSGNSELQAFLDNVPTYMQKINKVHLAAREGNIRELQSALDRRKFAIARDPISPNGATPLHVATVFGKTNIMKYLGGRFPETLSAVDFEGRTALHYAAILPDNGHYFNLLQQLGANSKDLDDNGHSAEDYLKNPDLLPFNQLLSDYGISEEAAQEMLSDKGTSQATNGHMDTPVFRTDEGRYLAKSLGDPLIKGLTEVANVKPKDPVAFLASFLQNFPGQEKAQLGTQLTKEELTHVLENVIVTREAAEVENEQPPSTPPPPPAPIAAQLTSKAARSASRTATKSHRPIDVVTVDPQPEPSPDGPETAFSSANRDEHGQSMLHFAAARTHTRNALFQLLQESDVSLAYRDELYRTARDVSIQANVLENTAEIDRWVLHLAARGNKEKIMELVMEGYDHIIDVVDEEGVTISDVIAQRGDSEMSKLLSSIPAFEESRETLHGAIRRGDLVTVQKVLSSEDGKTFARCQNTFGRTALHIAVLAQNEEIVAHLAQNYRELLRIGDNLERTPLHYAMGVEKIESLSRVLIRAGAKRVLKDLKGRQPSYYFMNKSDILRLKEEEDVY